MTDQDVSIQAWRLAAALARSRNEADAAGAVARSIGHLTGAEMVRVWLIDHVHGYRFAGSWPEEKSPPKTVPPEISRTVAFGSATASEAKRPYRSRLVVPLFAGPRPLGAVELLEKRRAAGAFAAADRKGLGPVLEAADAALSSVRQGVKREQRQAETVVRLTRLFDMGRSLTAATSMEELQSLIVDRVENALEVQAAYLWLTSESGEGVEIAAAGGEPGEYVAGWELGAGEGVAGAVAESGEGCLLQDPDDVPGFEERPDVQAGLEFYSLAAAPLISDDEEEGVLGVLEVINRDSENPYLDEADLAFLEEAARTAAVAIGNIKRLDAERRAGDLSSLLSAAQALSGSLETGKIAYTLVHQSASIMSYQRAAVGLFRKTRLEIAGVSGETIIDEKQPEMRRLRDMLEWAAGLEEGVYVVQEEDGTIDTARPETREKFQAYFEASGVRSFLGVPLKDDEGSLGVFVLEATEPYAFSEREIEAAELLGTTATTAFRNATLYQQIPLANVLHPWTLRKQKFMSMPWGKRMAWIGGTLALAAVFFLIPVPLRVGGESEVLPELRRPVIAEVEGRVARVLVHEGDEVEAGEVVAVLDDADYRAGAEEARSRHDVAMREQARLRAGGQTASAAVEAARLEGLRAEVDLWKDRLERTRIRSNVTGTIATPRVEDLAGIRLERGDVLCEVVDLDRQRVEIAIPEQDAGLVAPGMPLKVKLRAFPAESFLAEVESVGVAATTIEGEQYFMIQAHLLDPPVEIRSGLTGQAKINAGTASIARVILRRPARWIWSVIWGWLP